MKRRIFSLVLPIFLSIFSGPAQAEDPGTVYVPEVLRPWVRWVLDRDPALACPLVHETRQCFWPGTISLEVAERGGTFRQAVFLARDGRVAVPGGDEIFPIDVHFSGKSGDQVVPLLNEEGRPAVQLPAGTHTVTGRFAWKVLPQTLLLPKNTGLVSLKLSGAAVEHPRVNENGELWLHDASEKGEADEDTLRLSVSRKLSDGIPFHVVTSIELRVGGKAREVDLGKMLPEEFLPVRSQSELIHAFSREGSLKIQLRPGVHRLTIDAVRAEPPKSLAPPSPALREWPADEVWVWEADESLRSVSLSGAPGIDPQRTTLEENWKRFPAYALSRGGKLTFEETRRGEQDQPPNQLSLHRKFWLDLDGDGYTIEDNVSGKMFQEWRLNMNKPAALTRVDVNGQPQLITKDSRSGGDKPGVELRSPNIVLRALSRLDSGRTMLPAVGWDHEMNALSAQLMLPPGWEVIEIFGTDSNPGTWLSSWTLWDLFFLVLISIVVLRLKSPLPGIITFIAMGLSHQTPGAPHYAWLNVICGFALLRALPEGQARRWARWYFAASCSFIAVLLICFAIDQMRSGLFPQLGNTPLIDPEGLWGIFLGALAFAAVVTGIFLFVGAIVSLFTGHFRRFFRNVLLLAGACAVFASATTFLGGRAPVARYSKHQQESFQADFAPRSVPGAMAPAYDAAPQDASRSDEQNFEMGMSKGKESASGMGGRLMDNTLQRQALLQIDQKAVVQTGVGVPSWAWKTWSLGWNGPVERNREIELILLSPRINLFLSVVRVLLFLYLLLSFAREAFSAMSGGKSIRQAILGMLIIGFLPLSGKAYAQETPGDEVLKELETRLREKICTEDCIAANNVRFSVGVPPAQGEVWLTIEADVSSDGDSAWPVPGPLSEYFARSVLVDSATTDELRRDETGMLWVRVPKGVHKIRVEGSLARRNSATLQFSVIPQHVEVDAKDWAIDGLTDTGSVGESLQLVRQGQSSEKKDEGLENQAEVPLPDWFSVTREITLGQPWVVTTTVRRLGLNERSQLMRLPMLAGESVTDESIKVEGTNVLVSFPRGESSVVWMSTFREEPHFELVAPKKSNISEQWKLRCASIWRCAYDGIKPVHTLDGEEYLVDWRPWPGEKVGITVSKPLGVEGFTETVTDGKLHWDPGSGFMRGNLSFTVRSSQGGFRKITLPEGAQVQQVLSGGNPANIAPKGRVLELPLQPGEHAFLIKWQQPWAAAFSSRLPAVDIGSDAYNITVSSSVPQKRWLLWTSGPAWGPAVLFWGGLFVVILFGVVVGKIGVPPLSTGEWVLLGLGTATLHPAILLAPVAWSAFLLWRKQRPLEEKKWFNTVQAALILASFAVFLLLFASLYCGLIVDPDMGVRGQGSSTRMLRWYVDRTASALPQPLIVWLPMWVYRTFMLLWSTWLVLLIIRWIRWAWICLGTGGWWKK